MQESTKTKTFVGGAALMVVAAAISHFANQPRVADDFAKVGQPFFEEFQSSDQAKSLEVVAVDPETAERRRFKVANVDGLWRIPSHENYPAEASARLATTASSVMGIERESLAGRRKEDFERLGVVDPLKDDIDDPEAVGQRITLKDAADEVLADYIIGKQVDDVVVAADQRPFDSGENRQTYFYVRHADEQQTYVVPLKIDLSTKFSDWIDPDLLRFETSDLSQIVVRNYSLEEQAGGNPLMPQRALVKKVGDTLELTKSDSADWQLAGIDQAKEDFDAAPITELVGVLDELKIADVRKKTTFRGKQMLTPDLKLNEDPEFAKTPEQFQRAIGTLVGELQEKGFSLAGTQTQLELVSDNGEIEFGTKEGLKYTLHVGAPFEEDSSEIDVAGAVDQADADAAEQKSSEDESAEPSSQGSESELPSEAKEDADAAPAEDVKSRYMLVRVQFEEGLLENKPTAPVEPTEPQKPEGYEPPPEPASSDGEGNSGDSEASDNADQSEDKSEAAEDDESDANESKADGSTDTQDAEPDTKDSEPADQRPADFKEYDLALAEYEEAKVDYELALTRYEDDQKQFEERIAEAKKLEQELNERFGEWYYVISGENLKALQITRDQLVSAKETPEEKAGQANDPLPTRPDISFVGGPEAEPTEPPATEADEGAAGGDLDKTADGSAGNEQSMAGPAAATDSETSGDSADPANGDDAQGTAEAVESEAPSDSKPIAKPPTTPPAAEPSEATPAN